MSLFTEGLSPILQSCLTSFESELQQVSPNTRSDFHPTCLCPDCLEVQQENPTPSATNSDRTDLITATDVTTSYRPETDIEGSVETDKVDVQGHRLVTNNPNGSTVTDFKKKYTLRKGSQKGYVTSRLTD